MNPNPRKRGAGARSDRDNARTTADATPSLAGIIRGMRAGAALDDQVCRAFARLGHQMYAPGMSTTWVGAQQLVEALTTLGYFLELQTHADRCVCRVLRVLKGNAISKQMATTEAPTLPEAIAKAALLTLLETEPPG